MTPVPAGTDAAAGVVTPGVAAGGVDVADAVGVRAGGDVGVGDTGSACAEAGLVKADAADDPVASTSSPAVAALWLEAHAAVTSNAAANAAARPHIRGDI